MQLFFDSYDTLDVAGAVDDIWPAVDSDAWRDEPAPEDLAEEELRARNDPYRERLARMAELIPFDPPRGLVPRAKLYIKNVIYLIEILIRRDK